jgi:hypothetical protein
MTLLGNLYATRNNNLRMTIDITFNYQGIATKVTTVSHCSFSYTTNTKQIKALEHIR